VVTGGRRGHRRPTGAAVKKLFSGQTAFWLSREVPQHLQGKLRRRGPSYALHGQAFGLPSLRPRLRRTLVWTALGPRDRHRWVYPLSRYVTTA
jgi:hypothetical protein